MLDKFNFLIKSSVKNKQGIIYLGTSYGLLELDLNGKLKQVYKDKFKREPLLDDIENLAIDKLGYIWLGTTEHGLIKIKPETDNYQFENYFITKNKILSIIESSQDYIICGTENDPQDYNNSKLRLEEHGVIVMPSNAQAVRLAAKILKNLNK